VVTENGRLKMQRLDITKQQSKKQSSEKLIKHLILVRTLSDNPAAATESNSEFRKSTQFVGSDLK
jgi:hypothetical protein